ncbi:hypothetical protein WA026_014251 [Henosepilachna vigintioctopunctata]|uniref:Uncharacterized protein n=1 Tax=Henosepilachna vigintioctopunctata TaxID=420089 RepID=A0AAW1TKL8_9CUCU
MNQNYQSVKLEQNPSNKSRRSERQRKPKSFDDYVVYLTPKVKNIPDEASETFLDAMSNDSNDSDMWKQAMMEGVENSQ